MVEETAIIEFLEAHDGKASLNEAEWLKPKKIDVSSCFILPNAKS